MTIETTKSAEVSEKVLATVAVENDLSDVKAEAEEKPEETPKAPEKAKKAPRKKRAKKAEAKAPEKETVEKEVKDFVNASDFSANIAEKSAEVGKYFRLYIVSGLLDRPYGPSEKSIERNKAFLAAFSLSLSDREAGSKRIKAYFPKAVELRAKIKALKLEVGKGFTRKSLSEVLLALRKKDSGFNPAKASFISNASGRFRLVKGESGIRLTYPGVNNPTDDRLKELRVKS